MTRSINHAAIEKGTGKAWDQWLAFFDRIDASGLTHKEIAQRVHDEAGAPGWWCQTVTVAYEQHIGRRVPGQDCDGEFEVSVSKTLAGSLDDALDWWLHLAAGHTNFSDIGISRPGEVSQTDKWRYWRCGLADGSRINVNIYQKAPGKAALAIQHERIETAEQMEHWRSYWREFLTVR